MSNCLITLNGPPCSGKSSVVAELGAKLDLYICSYDKLKWQRTGYDAHTREHRRMVNQMFIALADVALSSGCSVVFDGSLATYQGNYKALANKYNARRLSVKLDTDFSLLETRFLERVSVQTGTKMSITTVDELRSRHDWWRESNSLPVDLEFNTGVVSAKEIAQRIYDELTLV